VTHIFILTKKPQINMGSCLEFLVICLALFGTMFGLSWLGKNVPNFDQAAFYFFWFGGFAGSLSAFIYGIREREWGVVAGSVVGLLYFWLMDLFWVSCLLGYDCSPS